LGTEEGEVVERQYTGLTTGFAKVVAVKTTVVKAEKSLCLKLVDMLGRSTDNREEFDFTADRMEEGKSRRLALLHSALLARETW